MLECTPDQAEEEEEEEKEPVGEGPTEGVKPPPAPPAPPLPPTDESEGAPG